MTNVERMKLAARQATVAKAIEKADAKPPKASKPRVEVLTDADAVRHKVRAACGCMVSAASLRCSACPACRSKVKSNRWVRTSSDVKARLPAGSAFTVTWDGQYWTGTLVIGGESPARFEGRANAVFRLLRMLDGAYRASLRQTTTTHPT